MTGAIASPVMHPTAARLAARLAERVRAVTGFSIGGIPPLGHDVELPTTVDESLRRFSTVWAAAATPHDVFAIETEALIAAIPGAVVTGVSRAPPGPLTLT